MKKTKHELRDPIHVFIRMETNERRVLDSRPFQRLRSIHQLGMTHFVYPGATHKRFEHCLGVMDIASRIFDVVTANPWSESVRGIIPSKGSFEFAYWRSVLRMAALCHDLGHLPFSHVPEGLLPEGWDHERISLEWIRSAEMEEIWKDLKLQSDDIAKLAVGPKKYAKYGGNSSYNDWQAILSEIVIGDAFGADRMDYLLRDSYHSGVAYGRFDHHRLIDCLRILPPFTGQDSPFNFVLGVEAGGLNSAEALLLARYFMFTQLYYHPVRRIYDIHLREFLKVWLPNGGFETDLQNHLRMTDERVISGIADSLDLSDGDPKKDAASRFINRGHFRKIYQPTPEDEKENPEPARSVFDRLVEKFGESDVRRDVDRERKKAFLFPVLTDENEIVDSRLASEVLSQIPLYKVDCVYVAPGKKDEAVGWLYDNGQLREILNHARGGKSND